MLVGPSPRGVVSHRGTVLRSINGGSRVLTCDGGSQVCARILGEITLMQLEGDAIAPQRQTKRQSGYKRRSIKVLMIQL